MYLIMYVGVFVINCFQSVSLLNISHGPSHSLVVECKGLIIDVLSEISMNENT